ncbi:hypothetical protein CQ10_05165 [Bradyrhizobium valentinum]|uniref:Uncharacterized protein n=1 Tax=Bradyrhizobium valentinum TaxID=1518501 RepID=A0A0R3KKI7_9BRAD|nr:hypothetical protein CP49_32235 [Bradyrhizobium valentinum]KRQ97222.1 hypothetical protein CQ10_05165 [Bradyrhizobium valentinum]
MQTEVRVGARADDSQSVELRDRAGMAMTVLTLQQLRVPRMGLRRMGRAKAKPITVASGN